MDILTAVMKVKNIWNTMDTSVIKKCWRHANVFPDLFYLPKSVIDSDLNRRLDEEALKSNVD